MTLDSLERERDATIYHLQSALQAEQHTEVAYLIGKLSQLQDIIKTIKDAEEF
ncbi:hypothetical protein Q9R38_26215 [Priestia aryabhattai]|uniref:hypothetical protein n=1 Tax=Priestia aryabhattai TaxID=412384 RepID=UPI0028826CF5|nr:hypothetical protein [Priestia aryabhattai]MDT0150040.1 hypothetical protein [Priestia aryabhattai]MDT0155610.1 hypothetical protein [Priestia aryabhattai]